MPDRGALPALEHVAQYEAVQLFVERARAARPDLTLTRENASAVVEICRRLDGLPLAIELAAARVRLLPPGPLLARLDRRLSLLTGGPSDRPARQQTLRGTIDWSYDLLTPADQLLFRRLAVFVGGFTLGAGFQVSGFGKTTVTPPETRPLHGGNIGYDVVRRTMFAGPRPDIPEPEILDGLASLIEQSLLQRLDVGDEPRFTMLETIREYALEQLEASGEAATIRRRHAEYVLSLAQAAEPRLLGPEQQVWLNRLERELDNIRAVLAWSRLLDPIDGDDLRPALSAAELGLRLAGALSWFWYIRCHLLEGRRWLEPMLATSDEMPADVRGRGLITLGRLMQAQSDLVRSSALLRRGYRLVPRGWRSLVDRVFDRRSRAERDGRSGLPSGGGALGGEPGAVPGPGGPVGDRLVDGEPGAGGAGPGSARAGAYAARGEPELQAAGRRSVRAWIGARLPGHGQRSPRATTAARRPCSRRRDPMP